jgi:hypothetical protein
MLIAPFNCKEHSEVKVPKHVGGSNARHMKGHLSFRLFRKCRKNESQSGKKINNT